MSFDVSLLDVGNGAVLFELQLVGKRRTALIRVRILNPQRMA